MHREIYDLRREGRLDEAKKRAEEFLQKDDTDQDLLKAYAWTLIDIYKKKQQNGNLSDTQQTLELLSRLHFDMPYDKFTETLVKKIQELKNPFYVQIEKAKGLSKNGNNDKAWEILSQLYNEGHLSVDAHESYGWTIYRYLKDHFKQLNSVQVRTQLRNYIHLQNERPSMLHSQILNLAINYSKFDKEFKLMSFFRLWDPNNLVSADFKDVRVNDDKTIPSLASRIAKVMVESEYHLDEIQSFIEMLPQGKDDFIEMLKNYFFWKLNDNTKTGVSLSTWNLFNQYLKLFPETSASTAHSKVLGLATRIMTGNNVWRFYGFFREWNPQKLRAVDWLEEKGANGAIYKPLAIRSLERAKEALKNLSNEQMGDLQWLISLYSTAIDKFPDDDWNIRSKALLHLRAGQQAEAKNLYKDLCMRRGENYYIWSEFADCCEEPNVKIALLCKALSLEKNEDFIGKYRLQLARQLIKLQKYGNAIVELNQYKNHYTKQGWHINSDINSLLKQCSSATIANDNNAALYAENILLAEAYAYADIPFTEVVLVNKWKNDEGKTMMFFVDGKTIEFGTNKKRFPILMDCHEGQVWKFKLYKNETVRTIPNAWHLLPPKKEIKYIPLTAAHSEMSDWLILPIQYGYVQHVNTEKKVYHIYSTESTLVYKHYEQQELEKGDFVKLRQYKRKVKEENKICFCDIQKCTDTEAIEHFMCSIATVDDVNNQRQLFHFIADHNLTGNLLYNQTNLRPSVGDCIKIHYFVRKIDDKKNPGKQKNVVEVLKAEATESVNANLIKYISGYLELKYREENNDGTPDFGFIDGCYVHKSILEKHNINSDCAVNAKAIYAGNGKWKVFEIDR